MIPYTAPDDAMAEIPVISYADGASSSSSARRALAARIGAACRDTGFFYLVDHGIPTALLDDQLAIARDFFALATEEKMRFTGIRGQYGYEPIAAQSLDAGSPPDLKESIMLAGERHLWPDMPAFTRHADAYHRAIIRLGMALAASLALSLDLAEDHFATLLAQPNCTVRMLHYPPCPDWLAANQLGAGAHTDWGFLTLLLQDAVGGLEVRTASGRWLRAAPVPGALVVNLGDMLPHLTNGLYRSNYHRVLNNVSGRDRYSVAAFFNPAPDMRFDCVPSCRPAGWVPRPMTVAAHVRARIAETYAARS